jgi:thiol-disulfide isomerase/thioredoxin
MTAGTVALLAALAVAMIAGGVWRRTNGRMRITVPAAGLVADRQAAGRPAAHGEAVPGVTFDSGAARPAAAVLANGGDARVQLTEDTVGHPLGDRATLLQFSTAFCAPCRATRRVLADVAGLAEGVAHVEIDAESRLDLVRQLNVLRTPTVLVLAGDGTIVRRASGQPRKPDVIAALGAAVDYNSYIYDRDS